MFLWNIISLQNHKLYRNINNIMSHTLKFTNILYICHTHSSRNILLLDQTANLYVYNKNFN